MPAPLPFDFATAVETDGYAWWYVDALADDGHHGLTVIFFIGSVFSPFYARARRRGPTAPEAHCAVNAILYGPTRRWAFSEYRARALSRDALHIAIGASALRWDGEQLHITLDERCAPLPRALRGTVTLTPAPLVNCRVALDAAGLHRWQPLAPRARVAVRMTSPALNWEGDAYFDSNHGARPLEQDFASWCWSRAQGITDTRLLYDLRCLDGTRRVHALRFPIGGDWQAITPPPPATLPATGLWRMPRDTRAAPGTASLRATWEDTPFYARSLIECEVEGTRRLAVHESLSLRRFIRPWVQWMLPFRMRRQLGR